MKLIPIATIRSAKRGDSTAVSEIILSFHTYITNRCVYKYQDKKGQTHMELDEDLQQIATLALLSAISGFEFLEMDVFDSEDACIQANQLRFIKYCTVSISHAIGNAHDERTALAARECFLSDTQVDELTITIPEIEEADRYLFAPSEFDVLGRCVYIRDSDLAYALRYQPSYLRNPVLAKWFFGYNDKELAILFKTSERTIRRRRKILYQNVCEYLSSID